MRLNALVANFVTLHNSCITNYTNNYVRSTNYNTYWVYYKGSEFIHKLNMNVWY